MRTRADLQAAAAGAGLVIDAIEAVPVAGGGTALATRMTFTDPWSAADLLFTLAEEDAGDPIVRAWSLEILTATADELGLALGPTITPSSATRTPARCTRTCRRTSSSCTSPSRRSRARA